MPFEGYRNVDTSNGSNSLPNRTDPACCSPFGKGCFNHLEASLGQGGDSAAAWILSVATAIARDHQNKELLFKLLRGQSRNHDRTPDVLNTARRIITAGLADLYDDDRTDELACNSACLALFKAVLLHAFLRALKNASPQFNTQLKTVADSLEPQQWQVVGEVLDEWELSIGGLAHACAEVFRFAYASATGSEGSEILMTTTLLSERKKYSVELLMGLTWIRDAARSKDTLLLGCRLPFHHDLPTPLELYMSKVEIHILEKLLFMPGSSMFYRMLAASSTIATGSSQNSRLLTPNDLVVHSTIRRLGLLASGRTVFLCRIAFKSLPDRQVERLINHSCILVGRLLGKHLSLLYDRHLTALLIGCIHHVAISHGLMIDIRTLKELAMVHLPFHGEQTKEYLSLVPLSKKKAKDMVKNCIDIPTSRKTGSIDEFYNTILLPILRSECEDNFVQHKSNSHNPSAVRY